MWNIQTLLRLQATKTTRTMAERHRGQEQPRGNLIELVRQISSFATLVYLVLQAYVEEAVNLFKPRRRKSIKNQNVLITGSGHGLGHELALRFAREGANLILVDINEENNEKVRAQLAKLYPNQKVLAYSADIRNESEVEQLAKKSCQDLGQQESIDILVNNAGIVQCRPFLELTPQLIERTLQVNVLAHMWTIKHFLPGMLAKKRGHLVAVSSIAGLIGSKFLTDYCASKFAVVGLMDSLEREIHDGGANPNIHLTTICPSCMSTGMFQTFRSRFSWLLPVLDAQQVAEATVETVLTNKTLAAFPAITLFFYRLSYLVPSKVNQLIQTYLDYGVRPHTS